MSSRHITIDSVFAYGTLRRGFSRQSCWPKEPFEIREGFVQGRLLDVGPYPGLVYGTDWIRGEAWQLLAADIDETLAALDEVEGYVGDVTHDLYQRVLIDVFDSPHGLRICTAYAYLLNDQNVIDASRWIEPVQRIAPSGNYSTYAQWPS